MTRLLIALLVLIALAVPAAAQPGPAVHVIGPVTPGNCAEFNSTTVIKDSGGGCASGSILGTNNVWTGTNTYNADSYFASGRPWCDPRSEGALGNASHDDTAAFNTCLANIAAAFPGAGGYLFVPAGYYCINSGITISLSITILGASPNSTFLSPCGQDVTVVTLDHAQASMNGITIFGKGSNLDAGGVPTFGATQPALTLGTSCGSCKLDYVFVQGGSVPLFINGSADQRIVNSSFSQGYGVANIRIVNASSPKFSSTSADQQFPVSLPTAPITINPWAANTVYNAGDIVSTAGYLIQARVGGTSCAIADPCAGAAPTLNNYLVDIPDGVGTLIWRLVAPATYYGLMIDTGTNELFADKMNLTGAFTASLASVNTLAGTPPSLNHLNQATFGDPFNEGVLLNSGARMTIYDSEFLSCLTAGCSNVLINGTWSSEATFVHNTVSGNPIGFNVTVGTDFIAENNQFNGNTTGIQIAANIGRFSIPSNTFFNGTNGVVVAAGTSDNYYIGPQICDTITNCVTDGGTGIVKQVWKGPDYGKSIGDAAIGTWQNSAGFAFFGTSALDQTLAGNYAMLQDVGGNTIVNSAAGQPIDFRINNANKWIVGATGGFYSAAATGGDMGNGKINIASSYNINGNPLAFTDISGTLAVNKGGTGQTTAPSARAASGLNIDSATTFGNVNYNALITDRVIATAPATVFSASRTVTLPLISTYNPGQQTTVIDSAGAINGANTMVIAATAPDTINGAASVTIATQYSGAVLWPIGANKWGFIAAAAGGVGTVTSVTCGGTTITTSGSCPPSNEPHNCSITATVAGNNLTVALKDHAGADPSASSPCWIPFRNSTVGTGTVVARTVTAATSFTANAGSSFGCPILPLSGGGSAIPHIWVVAVDSGATAVLGVVCAFDGFNIKLFESSGVITSVACSACINATTAGTFYTTAAQTNKPYRVLGYLEWDSGLATAGTWAGSPTKIVNYTPEIALPGRQLQSRHAEFASATAEAAGTLTDTADTLTITPHSAASIFRMEWGGRLLQSGTGAVIAELRRDPTGTNVLVGIPIYHSIGAATLSTSSVQTYDAPGVTTAITYTVQVATSVGGQSVTFCAATGPTNYCFFNLYEIQS